MVSSVVGNPHISGIQSSAAASYGDGTIGSPSTSPLQSAHAPPCLRLGVCGTARWPAHAPPRLRLGIYGAARPLACASPRQRPGLQGATHPGVLCDSVSMAPRASISSVDTVSSSPNVAGALAASFCVSGASNGHDSYVTESSSVAMGNVVELSSVSSGADFLYSSTRSDLSSGVDFGDHTTLSNAWAESSSVAPGNVVESSSVSSGAGFLCSSTRSDLSGGVDFCNRTTLSNTWGDRFNTLSLQPSLRDSISTDLAEESGSGGGGPLGVSVSAASSTLSIAGSRMPGLTASATSPCVCADGNAVPRATTGTVAITPNAPSLGNKPVPDLAAVVSNVPRATNMVSGATAGSEYDTIGSPSVSPRPSTHAPPSLRLGIYGAASPPARAPPRLRLGIYMSSPPPQLSPLRLSLLQPPPQPLPSRPPQSVQPPPPPPFLRPLPPEPLPAWPPQQLTPPSHGRPSSSRPLSGTPSPPSPAAISSSGISAAAASTAGAFSTA